MLAIAGMKGASIACELFCDKVRSLRSERVGTGKVDEIEKEVGDIHHQSRVRRSLLTHSANNKGLALIRFTPPRSTF